MGIFKKHIFLILIMLFAVSKVHAYETWNNDLATIYSQNKAIIYAINIRTFNAKDKNNDGIIDESVGEERGNFINAIDRLDELVNAGINTVQLLPITPVGKTKALGTAGSLYSPSSFNELNPQLKCNNSILTLEEEAKKFIDECHKRKLRVIVDLPCCGSYDLYLKNSLLFQKDINKNPITPCDWTDVRLLDAGTDSQLNPDLYNLYAEFVDMAINLDIDGIRANIPSTKPYTFWKKLITETKSRNPQFLFIAEASYDSNNPVSNSPIFTSTSKLLDAGFDGYYGNYNNIKDWKSPKELYTNVRKDLAIAQKHTGTKRVLGNFATHDQISPVLTGGPLLSRMIIWLNATLPMNTYHIDGFSTGDNYLYQLANKKASVSFTDDDYYFVHRGQLDIFNFSRKPRGNNADLYQNFIMANRFKVLAGDIISNGTFVTLKTSNPNVFAYARSYNNQSIIVIGNMDLKKEQKNITYVPKINSDLDSIPIALYSVPKVLKGRISSILTPGEVQVLTFNQLNLK